MYRFGLLVKFHPGESAINEDTPNSYILDILVTVFCTFLPDAIPLLQKIAIQKHNVFYFCGIKRNSTDN